MTFKKETHSRFLAGFILQTIDYRKSRQRPTVRTVRQSYYYTAPVQTAPQPAPPPPPPPEEEYTSGGSQQSMVA